MSLSSFATCVVFYLSEGGLSRRGPDFKFFGGVWVLHRVCCRASFFDDGPLPAECWRLGYVNIALDEGYYGQDCCGDHYLSWEEGFNRKKEEEGGEKDPEREKEPLIVTLENKQNHQAWRKIIFNPDIEMQNDFASAVFGVISSLR